MNTDIKGENGHCGHEMYITFLGRTGQILVIFKKYLRHAVDRLDKATRGPRVDVTNTTKKYDEYA